LLDFLNFLLKRFFYLLSKLILKTIMSIDAYWVSIDAYWVSIDAYWVSIDVNTIYNDVSIGYNDVTIGYNDVSIGYNGVVVKGFAFLWLKRFARFSQILWACLSWC